MLLRLAEIGRERESAVLPELERHDKDEFLHVFVEELRALGIGGADLLEHHVAHVLFACPLADERGLGRGFRRRLGRGFRRGLGRGFGRGLRLCGGRGLGLGFVRGALKTLLQRVVLGGLALPAGGEGKEHDEGQEQSEDPVSFHVFFLLFRDRLRSFRFQNKAAALSCQAKAELKEGASACGPKLLSERRVIRCA